MEFSKKHLLKIIKESSEEIDEMSKYQRAKSRPWDPDYPKNAEGKSDFVNAEPGMNKPNVAKGFSMKQLDPDEVEDSDSRHDVWIYPGHKKIGATIDDEEYVKKHSPDFYNWVEYMEAQHGYEFVKNPVHVTSSYNKKTGKTTVNTFPLAAKNDPLELAKSAPGPKAMSLRGDLGIDIPEKDAINLPIKTNIDRKLLPAMRGELGRKSVVQAHADKIGLPIINLPRRKPGYLRHGTNLYGTVNNTTVVWGSKNYDSYGSYDVLCEIFDDLIEDKDNLINPKELQFKKTGFLDRQYNLISKTNAETPDETNPNEIRIYSEIEVNGGADKTFSTFTWLIEVTYYVLFNGKKVMMFIEPFKSEQTGKIDENLKNTILSYKGEEGYGPYILQPIKGTDEEGNVIEKNNEVFKALRNAINDIGKQIMSIGSITDVIGELSRNDIFGQKFYDYITGEEYDDPTIGAKSKKLNKPKKGPKAVSEPKITTKTVGKKQVAREGLNLNESVNRIIQEIKKKATKRIK